MHPAARRRRGLYAAPACCFALQPRNLHHHARARARFPRLIHQTVRNKSHLSCQQRSVIASWARLNPGYSHVLWDDADMRAFMARFYPQLLPTPYDEFLNAAERTDLWRVLVLHQVRCSYAHARALLLACTRARDCVAAGRRRSRAHTRASSRLARQQRRHQQFHALARSLHARARPMHKSCTCTQLGGVYADMDVQCLVPIASWNIGHGHDASLLLGVENYDAARPEPLHVANWVAAACPGHPLLGRLPGLVLKTAAHQFLRMSAAQGVLTRAAYEAGILDRTGPAALTRAVYAHFASANASLQGVTHDDVASAAGVAAGGARLLPITAFASGWEVRAGRAASAVVCMCGAAALPRQCGCWVCAARFHRRMHAHMLASAAQ